jgi:hypothetical protein
MKVALKLISFVCEFLGLLNIVGGTVYLVTTGGGAGRSSFFFLGFYGPGVALLLVGMGFGALARRVGNR